MATHALPRPASRDTHHFVVVPNAASGGERIAQPESVLGSNSVGDIAEGGCPLVGGDHQVRVISIKAHSRGRWHDLVAHDVVGEVEQARNELAVTGHALGTKLIRGSRRPLQDKAAFRTRWHDDGVLHDLCLHQAQDLGAEVFATVAPTNSATRNASVPKVYTLQAGRAHPYLEQGPRQREVGHLAAVEFERNHIAVAGIRTWAECVGAHGRLDECQQRPQRTVVVEAWNSIERVDDPSASNVCLGGAVTVVRRESGCEKLNQLSGDAGVTDQRCFDVLLTEGEADLTQIAGIGAQQLHLAGGQPCPHHQPVQSVDLHRVVELRHKGALDLGLRGSRQLDVVGYLHSYVVQPHGPLFELKLERTLVDGPKAQLIEQWQQVRDRNRRPGAVHPKPPLCAAGFDEVQHCCLDAVVGFERRESVDDGKIHGCAVRPIQLVVPCRHDG